MKTSDFDYYLPPEQIAQTPLEPRHSSRLLVLNRNSTQLEHKIFFEIDEYFSPNDVLVINRTRVIPARIFGNKMTGGKVEVLLLTKRGDYEWEVLVGGKKMKVGQTIYFPVDLHADITGLLEGSRRIIRFSQPVEKYLHQIGEMPLPPYIHTKLQDQERYQTIYSKTEGSAAAPTAGLHFTNELIQKLINKGIKFAEITLHVGLDTFAPVYEDEPEKHQIHSEWCEIDQENANIINVAKSSGGRIIAVGTTSVRTLESAALIVKSGIAIGEYQGPTRLFILPGFQFKVVDAMITNFHLPKSTLLMLVSAFATKERILATYQEAVLRGYRFFSFGDAMLIL